MLTSLLVSLSLTVPYLPQSDLLCGGAAAAMVLRYWGQAHAGVDEFAPLVDRRAGGIADDVLVKAIVERGWTATPFAGSVERLRDEIEQRHPVIVLVADGSVRYHYVVVIGFDADRVLIHDPSWGPSRPLPIAELMRIWEPTGFWSLLILPRDRAAADTPQGSAAESPQPARSGLPEPRRLGPMPGSLGELAGLRFADRQWARAAELATAAVARDPSDRYAWDVLGSSRFMQDDLAGALVAWNRIEKPRVDLVEIEGLRRTRYQAIAATLDLPPNTLLTAHDFQLADRRLQELPDRILSRLSYAPDADGFATVHAAIVERSLQPQGPAEWIATGLRTGVDREVRVNLPDTSGQGGLWTASWRFWPNRPQVALSFAAPHFGSIGGVWRVDGSWDSQAYSSSATDTFTEAHTHGGLTVSNWMTPALRYSVSAGFDRWHLGSDDVRAPFFGGSLERRWLDGRVSTSGQVTTWLPTSDKPAFSRTALRVAFTSSLAESGWTFLADLGTEHASASAPLGIWPGAGDGYIRAPLLRAHPLLDNGVVQLGDNSVFGRTVTYANAEVQRWLPFSSPVRFGIAGFADMGTAAHDQTVTMQVDLGVGPRVRMPRGAGTLRIDFAHGVPDGANAVTIGWQF